MQSFHCGTGDINQLLSVDYVKIPLLKEDLSTEPIGPILYNFSLFDEGGPEQHSLSKSKVTSAFVSYGDRSRDNPADRERTNKHQGDEKPATYWRSHHALFRSSCNGFIWRRIGGQTIATREHWICCPSRLVGSTYVRGNISSATPSQIMEHITTVI